LHFTPEAPQPANGFAQRACEITPVRTNSQIVFPIIFIGRIQPENAFFGRIRRDHEIAGWRVPFRIFGMCTKTD